MFQYYNKRSYSILKKKEHKYSNGTEWLQAILMLIPSVNRRCIWRRWSWMAVTSPKQSLNMPLATPSQTSSSGHQLGTHSSGTLRAHSSVMVVHLYVPLMPILKTGMIIIPCRRFRNPDVPTCLMKMAPDYCTVHVIHKAKAIQVKAAKAPAPFTTLPPKQYSQSNIESDGSSR